MSTQSDNTVYVVDASTFQRIAGPVRDGPTGISAFSPNGQTLALAGDGFALMDMPSHRIRWPNLPWYVSSLGFSPDGRLIVAGSDTGTIATLDTHSGRLAAGPQVAHPGPSTRSPSPRAAGSSSAEAQTARSAFGTQRICAPSVSPCASDNVGALATFSADGAKILALDATSRITTWDATVSAWLARACSIAGHRDFTPEERTLFSITPIKPTPLPLKSARTRSAQGLPQRLDNSIDGGDTEPPPGRIA